MLDSTPSHGQGLNQIQLRLDCRSRPASPADVALSATGLESPAPVDARDTSQHLHDCLGETALETHPLPTPPPPPAASVTTPLSSSSSASSRYTLSSTVPAPTVTTPPSRAQSPPGSPRISSLHVDAGSPKIRSPLRNSVTFSEGPDGLHLYSTDNTSSVPRTPATHTRFHSVDMALTGDRRMRNSPRPADPPMVKTSSSNSSPVSDGSSISRWFSRGNSYSDASSSSTTSPPRTRSASSTPKISSPGSRFPFFSSSTSTLKEVSNSHAFVPQNDELLNLDIEAALFPGGQPSDGNAFSPAAFKNLQMNATGLINKFHAAYQQRSIEYQELRAEREAQAEEKDEMDIRVQHLKMQLEDMARKAAEREENMASLLQELAMEKRARAEEQAAREKFVASSGTSTVSEDLGVDEDRQRLRHNWRKSTATAKSDLSLDTDEDSIDEASIFSRSRSPTLATNMSETTSPLSTPTPQQKPVMLELPRPSRSSTPQLSTFQKLFKNYSSETPDLSPGIHGCRNCQDTSVAWDTVNLLKHENKGLKTRVEELESAVESALDVVNGIGL